MPSANAELYCTLYVAGAADPDALAAALGDITQGHVTQGAAWVQTPLLDMAVHAESRHLPLSDTQDDFSLWRHFVEVNAADGAMSFQAFLAALARVVAALRAGVGARWQPVILKRSWKRRFRRSWRVKGSHELRR